MIQMKERYAHPDFELLIIKEEEIFIDYIYIRPSELHRLRVI